MKHKETTESDIVEYASKWLAQASVRIKREKNEKESEK